MKTIKDIEIMILETWWTVLSDTYKYIWISFDLTIGGEYH